MLSVLKNHPAGVDAKPGATEISRVMPASIKTTKINSLGTETEGLSERHTL
jgi:hypothetical protein